MSKPSDRLIELKRAVRTLLALDGRVLALPSGAWLVQRGQVIDPIALLNWAESALAPGAQALAACMTPGAHCEPLSTRHLAAAQHAWSQLRAQRELLADTPARWLGGQRRDDAWLQTQRERLNLLGQILRTPATGAEWLSIWCAPDDGTNPPLTRRQQALALLEPGPLKHWPTADLDNVPDAVWLESLALCVEQPRAPSALAAELIVATAGWGLPARTAWWPWLVQGIAWADIEAWPAKLRAQAAPPANWPWPAVQVYVRLASDLHRIPGGGPALSLAAFSRLPAARKPALVALASALELSLRPAGSRAQAEQRVAWADASLRLQSTPAAPPAAEAGLGMRCDAAFAAWLDDPILDRYLGLRRALGEPLQVSTRLRQDFQSLERSAGQRRFLSELPLADPRRAQLARLALGADPARTRRRLQQDCTRLELQWRLAAADQQLQSVLTRVIGCVPPVWDDAWRDGARLYLAVERNHAELRTLLRAAACGQAVELRRQLPANAAWIEQAAEHFDVDAWLAPIAHSLPLRGQHYAIRAEHDPLQALRMGLAFDSCLAIDDGCNRHSAIINALDANKWVVYVRDASERIVARQLIGVSSQWQLVGYRVYTSMGQEAELRTALASFAHDLAERAGLTLAGRGEPVTLNGQDWYDDGTHEWPTQALAAGSEVADYCALLGLALPPAPDADLIREARCHALACQGRIEALPPWVDGWPSGLRNVQLLRARLGGPVLLRLLGHPQRRRDYELAQIADGDVHAVLSCISRWKPRPQGYMSLPLAAPVSTAALHLACALVESADDNQILDDHGVEHALLRFAPNWAQSASLAALGRELPRVLQCFDKLARQLTDCADCIECAQLGLLIALQNAWLRDRDPEHALTLLKARGSSPRWPRLLLRLAASVHLAEPGRYPLFDSPRPAAAVQRALALWLRRDPTLSADPHYWVACWRHGEASQPQLPDVWPQTAPFDALGDLLLALPTLWPALRRYAPKPGELPQLSAAQAFWHRQTPTAWRDGLITQLAAGGDPSLEAAKRLVQINDPALTRLALDRSARPRGPRSADGSNPQDQARLLLVRQLSPKRLPTGLLCGDDMLDLGALARLWPTLLAESGDLAALPPDWATALTLHPDSSLLTDYLLHSEALPWWAPAYLEVALGARTVITRWVALTRHPALASLADRVIPLSWTTDHANQLLAHLEPTLAERWLRGVLAAGDEELLRSGSPDWFARLAALARSACTPAVWLALYQELPDALAISLFLQALEREDAAALRAAIPAEMGDQRRYWLDARLAQLGALPAQAQSAARTSSSTASP